MLEVDGLAAVFWNDRCSPLNSPHGVCGYYWHTELLSLFRNYTKKLPTYTEPEGSLVRKSSAPHPVLSQINPTCIPHAILKTL